ncbi:eukaryotic translation initiation factor 2-alpha kinase 3 [Caerostris extrusa]|uniref:Eukaryotic translation initiation factor 2-alpha kinase 3 n=1 Tax=Caerostris extrusa TaxID=172846 RepID=A0AAV4UZ36_CAEEX|nr:eukaryotic translation initiation factor 2-alpha kinase 3 [Caerostris extrusa]
MDGNITALDFNFGFKCWSIVLDPKGFLSSTLSKLKVWENGTQVWIVPSLDGHMFKYDKMKLEPFSFNSEHLVNHAFIIDSSSSITGGKFKVIYGLNRHTGQGCQHFKTVSAKDVLIIEQWIHLVNAVDRVTAEQRWHFRGVEVKICDFNESSPVNTSQNVPETPLENTALVPVHNFNKVKKVLDSIKISLINGYAARLDHSSSSLIWLYKTSTPVVDVWFVQDKSAILVDPFSDGLKFFSPVSDDGMHAAWLFLGSFMGQLYVKQSKIFHSNVNDHAVSRPVPSKAFCLHCNSLIEPDTRYLNALVPSNINVKVHGVYYYANFSVYDNDTHCVVNVTFPKMKFNVFFAVCVLLALLYFLCLKRFLFKEQEKVFANESTSTTELPILPPETSDKTVEVKPEFSSRFHKDFEFITILGRGDLVL